jgi:16S rRNA (cytidine1402-2'-O)-methyltransferase
MKLYLVPTPIGNIADITLRALEVLKSVDVILCEDTRTSGHLLKHYDIQKPLYAHHQHNEHSSIASLVSQLQGGRSFALITDAGTPGISDPGFLLVRACVEAQVPVECLPGATAFVPALVQSGLPNSSFVFEGFLPPKKGRKTKLEQLAIEERTIVLYESPHRLTKTLLELAQYFGSHRKASVSRELTKMFEDTQRGSLEDLAKFYEQKPAKGEIVMVIEGYTAPKKSKYEKFNKHNTEESDFSDI